MQPVITDVRNARAICQYKNYTVDTVYLGQKVVTWDFKKITVDDLVEMFEIMNGEREPQVQPRRV